MNEPQKPANEPSLSNTLDVREGVMWQIATIGLLIVGLLVPLMMISGVITERQNHKDEVTNQIATTWGSDQLVIGPILAVPYKKVVSSEDSAGKKHTQTSIETAYLLPKKYSVKSNLKSEVRYRGIYKSVVYTSNFAGSGEFDLRELRDIRELKIPVENFVWEDAFVLVNIPQPKTIQTAPDLQWNGKGVEVFPGTHNSSLFDFGLYSPVSCKPDTQVVPFSIKLSLKGSNSFSLVPIGKQNSLEIASDWDTPSFTGSISPTSREISKQGFTALWQVPYFARKYSQTFDSTMIGANNPRTMLEDSKVGVDLIVPIDFYRQSDRATKYGILFLVLTFSTYFLIGIIGKFRVHPFQYLLVGCALCLFYLLLVALAELIGFNWAYLNASLSVVISITLYSRAILAKKGHFQLVVAGLLSVLYAYLFILLQLEDYSLLFGAIGLFAVLTAIMYVTRNIDWYNTQV